MTLWCRLFHRWFWWFEIRAYQDRNERAVTEFGCVRCERIWTESVRLERMVP